MKAKDIMTGDPACCTRDTNLEEVAKLMDENDCGCIPVVEDESSRKPVGVVTDRDITCRVIAQGQNALEKTAGDCMSTPCVTVTEDTSMEDCCRILEEKQIRRVPVIDSNGDCCGMVAQADIARDASREQTAGVLKEVSKETDEPSAVRNQEKQSQSCC